MKSIATQNDKVPHLRAQQYLAASFPFHIADVLQGPLQEHSHEFFEVVYVRRGRGEHRLNGRSYALHAGDLYLIRPGECHAYAPLPQQKMRIINVLWMPALTEQLWRTQEVGGRANWPALEFLATPKIQHDMPQSEECFSPRLHLSPRAAYRVETLLDEMRREQNSGAPGCQMLLCHLFCTLMILLSREWQKQNAAPAASTCSDDRKEENTKIAAPHERGDVVGEAIAWLEENYARPVRVADVASHVALSAGRLAHVFKARTERGVIEYLHEYRIARAAQLLCETSQSAQSIAQQTGFNDPRFFHRLFRRHTGCTPGQFRRQFQHTEILR